MKRNFVNEIRAKLYARSGVLWVRDEDEDRVVVKARQAAAREGYDVWIWKTTAGLVRIADTAGNTIKKPAPDEVIADVALDPAAFMQLLANWQKGPSIIIAFDLISLLNRMPSPMVLGRALRDHTMNQQIVGTEEEEDVAPEEANRGVAQLVVIDFEEPSVPCGIQRIVMELPDRAECEVILDGIMDAVDASMRDAAEANRERILNALAGLPAYQLSNALAESIARTQTIDPAEVREYKKAMVAKKGLTWVDTDPRGFGAIGGMGAFKEWATKRKVAFGPKAKEYGIEPPRGVIVAGVPGTGKSANVKGLAEEWGFTLLRFDVGQTRGKFQGDGEAAFEEAIKTAEAIAPCILHIDEAEKQFGGVGASGDTDGGTGARTFSFFLTWLQERTASVFCYLTANRPDTLPPEFMRAGRLDGNWWVDVPTDTERDAIVDVFRTKFPKATDVDKAAIVQAADRNTGAEIEQAFREALIQALCDERDATTDDIVTQIERLPKVADTFVLEDSLKAWRDAAMRANDPEQQPQERNNGNAAPRRKLGLQQ